MPIGRYEPMADGTDMRADMESGTCPSGTDKPPGKATFNATLRCKIVAGQAAHKLADALPADIRESGHGQQSVAPLATQFKNENAISPLMQTIATMEKEDLAELAENLIYLTSLKRRITPDMESVGGPVDVAIVSKGDGFIWIKRKHYFDPALNRCYFDTYFENENKQQ